MSKKARIFLIILILINFIALIPNDVFAKNPDTPAGQTGTTDNFSMTRFDNTSVAAVNTAAQTAMGTAINIIRIVGTGISIIMITYMAIKYMTSAPQERAEFKKSAAIYVVGAILIFGGTNVLTSIMNFASSNITAVK